MCGSSKPAPAAKSGLTEKESARAARLAERDATLHPFEKTVKEFQGISIAMSINKRDPGQIISGGTAAQFVLNVEDQFEHAIASLALIPGYIAPEGAKKDAMIALDAVTQGFLNDAKLSDIVIKAFSWGRSPEGFQYWNDLHNELLAAGL